MTSASQEILAERFESHRSYLRAVAYRLLGSVSDADDAVQDAWLRLGRVDPASIDDLRAWLTTVVARLSLNRLRDRRSHRESSLETHLPDPVVVALDSPDPEQEALIGDAVGMALQVVLDTLTPAERVAFVLHDVFGMPFEDIAPIAGRTPAAARQLASRARRRVRGAPVPDATLDDQWTVVNAFLAAAREGDVGRLVVLLDPDIVLHSDGGTARPGLVSVQRGAEEVAAGAMTFRRFVGNATPVIVNGTPGGIAWTADGRPFAILAMTVKGGRIAEIDVLADPARLAAMGLDGFGGRPAEA
ncbi:MAG: sigma-70 family RNA polymerase sigma factor [Candidatus Limnocylindrales bacterium]